MYNIYTYMYHISLYIYMYVYIYIYTYLFVFISALRADEYAYPTAPTTSYSVVQGCGV